MRLPVRLAGRIGLLAFSGAVAAVATVVVSAPIQSSAVTTARTWPRSSPNTRIS